MKSDGQIFALTSWMVVCAMCGKDIGSEEVGAESEYEFAHRIGDEGWHLLRLHGGWCCPECVKKVHDSE